MNLYFEDSRGKYRLVKNEVKNQDEAFPLITSFVHKLNPNFKIYYFQIHTTNEGMTIFDVGSHTEFFVLTEKFLN